MNTSPDMSTLDGWTVEVTNLHGLDEVIDVPSRLILIDPTRHGEEWMRLHAGAHIHLEHHVTAPCGAFSDEMEAEADWWASVTYGERVSAD